MRFIADENFRLDVTHWLITQGHDVKRVPLGCDDAMAAQAARKERRILLTNDSDFSMTLRFPPKEYPGILIFHIHPPRFDKYVQAAKNFLAARPFKSIHGRTFIVEENFFAELE